MIHPLPTQWTPTRDYEEVDIGALVVGPRCVTFMGRVVNFYNVIQPNKRPLAGQGNYKIMVGDDTGRVTVRIIYLCVNLI